MIAILTKMGANSLSCAQMIRVLPRRQPKDDRLRRSVDFIQTAGLPLATPRHGRQHRPPWQRPIMAAKAARIVSHLAVPSDAALDGGARAGTLHRQGR
jgi:hypothetical protein